MEDLKKQTALRLAQEQNESPLHQHIYVSGGGRQQQLGVIRPCNLNNNNYAVPSTDLPVTYPRQVQNNQDYQSQQQQQHTRDGVSNDDTDLRHLQHLTSQERQQYCDQQQKPFRYFDGSVYNQTSYMLPQDQNAIPRNVSEHQFLESHHAGNYTQSIDQQMMSRSTQPLQPASTVCVPPNSMHLKHQQPPTSYSPDGSQLSTMTRNNPNTLKTKLPHGLTVYELKEMTKARLQSEAAEKSNEYSDIQALARDRVSPLDFDSGEAMRERAFSRDSSSAGRINNNHVTSYLQHHQVAPKVVQTQLQSQPQMLQTGLHQSSVLGGGNVPSNFRVSTSRNDTWDSTSVASHNSTIYSENLGSETASEVGSFGPTNHRNRSFTYPAVQCFQPLDVSTTFTSNGFKESRSFSNPSPVQASPHRGSGMIGGQSLFNAAVGGNRRRAVTLSPNTGSILEDRPLRYNNTDSGDRLEIPNFSSGMSDSTSLSAGPPTQTLQRDYSPVLEQLGLGLDNSYLSNRNETSGVFRSVAVKNGSPLPGISQIGSREHDGLQSFSTTNNPSNLFRGAPTIESTVAAAPAGFIASNNSPRSQTAFSRFDRDPNINRKSNLEPGSNFETLKSQLNLECNLVTDLGSVLDLSGSGGRLDRERGSVYALDSSRSHNNNSHFKNGFQF